jgi:hypothetical protein
MFKVDDKFYTWSSTRAGRGARAELVTSGAYIIDHINTGWCIIGHSRTVSAEVDKQIELFQNGRHPNKRFLSQYLVDPERDPKAIDIKIMEFPTKSVKDAKALEARLRCSMKEHGCESNMTN